MLHKSMKSNPRSQNKENYRSCRVFQPIAKPIARDGPLTLHPNSVKKDGTLLKRFVEKDWIYNFLVGLNVEFEIVMMQILKNGKIYHN